MMATGGYAGALARLTAEFAALGFKVVVHGRDFPELQGTWFTAPDDSLRFIFRKRSLWYSVPPHPAVDVRFGYHKLPEPLYLTAQELIALAQQDDKWRRE